MCFFDCVLPTVFKVKSQCFFFSLPEAEETLLIDIATNSKFCNYGQLCVKLLPGNCPVLGADECCFYLPPYVVLLDQAGVVFCQMFSGFYRHPVVQIKVLAIG